MTETVVPVEDAGTAVPSRRLYKSMRQPRAEPITDAGAMDLPAHPYNRIYQPKSRSIGEAGAVDQKPVRVAAHERAAPQPRQPAPPPSPAPKPPEGKRRMAWSKLVDLELTDEEKLDALMPMPVDRPDYSFGLKICLCDPELDKLELEMPEVGDMIDLRAFAIVTSISNNDGKRRVELQITHLAAEDEMDEEMC